jgi:hypothetical protein
VTRFRVGQEVTSLPGERWRVVGIQAPRRTRWGPRRRYLLEPLNDRAAQSVVDHQNFMLRYGREPGQYGRDGQGLRDAAMSDPYSRT